jgi:hypothetical protein
LFNKNKTYWIAATAAQKTRGDETTKTMMLMEKTKGNRQPSKTKTTNTTFDIFAIFVPRLCACGLGYGVCWLMWNVNMYER